ncbi:glycosyl transferase [Candidatus Woesearchaeota archaeon CG10_big_fil_rev_8_21_14_0_10_34_8]|nr:MAG: glycosyl transferase [Candidatus Woesearchaeota archaeon CG10_big_fil_rev_8_21_14_0_10_34_8]
MLCLIWIILLNKMLLTSSMKLSIVIPAYNEEKRIKASLEKIIAYMKKERYDYEIIVINDGSTDKTKEVVLEFNNVTVLDNPNNKGKGYSVRGGFLYAKGDWILFSDADLSTPIEELETCFRYIKEYEVIIASRNLPMSKIVVKQPLLRSNLGKIFPFFVRLLLLPGIHDSQCGFKLFSNKAAKAVAEKQKIEGFCFDAEQMFIAKKLRYKIKEIPVTWANDERSKVRIIKDSLKMFFDLFKVRINALNGAYDKNLNK